MGVSAATSLASHILAGNSHRRTASYHNNDRNLDIHIAVSKVRLRSKKISASKFQVAEFEERTSPIEVKKEVEQCYELIHRLGRGVVYLGSSRFGSNHPHYNQTLELAREVANLLDCTSWSGAGPGLMDAATQGALQARKPVGGFKIGQNSTTIYLYKFSHANRCKNGATMTTLRVPVCVYQKWCNDDHIACTKMVQKWCNDDHIAFFSARKHGLVDAVVRSSSSDRTAVVALPGGIGTLDEVFEILALIQLERIGSVLPVPFILMNYDSFYSKLLDFLDDCKKFGTVADGEVDSLWKVCHTNSEALAYLSDFYNLS